MKSLSIVIPAHNEERNIAAVLQATLEVTQKLPLEFEIIVIDDRSSDDTARVVEGYAAGVPEIHIFHNSTQLGAQPSILRGLRMARGDAMFFLPADHQVMPDQIPRCLDALEEADLVWTWRRKRADKYGRRVMAGVFNLVVRSLTKLRLHDIDSCILVRAEAFRAIEHHISSESSFIFAELATRAAAAGFRIVEVEIEHHPRTAGAPSAITPREILRAMNDVITVGTKIRRL